MATPVATGQQPATPNEGMAARMGSKIRKWKDLTKAAQAERDAHAAKIAELEAQVKDLSGRADGNEAAKQRDELKAQIRDRDHKEAFTRAAKAAGASTDAQINDLWKLSEYKAETDVPDPAKIETLIAAQKVERSYLFGTAPQPGNPRPGAGGGKGASDADNQGNFVVTRAQANDPVWMHANAKKINQAEAEGRFILESLSPTR